MKKSIEKLLLPLFLLIYTCSCQKQENKVYFQGGTAPVLTASKAGVIAISFATKDEEAVKLSWTNPNYQFNTGISSHNVDYLLEIDTVGANFTNPGKKVLAISKDLSKSFSQSEMNDLLLNDLVLKPGIPHQLAVRIISNIKNGSANIVPLTSNILPFTVTPYTIPPKVTPPASGTLYITGSATKGSWMSDNPPSPVIPAQTFTMITSTVYELSSIELNGGQEYLLVPVFGNWSKKYGATVATGAFNPDGGDFQEGGNNFKAPAATGNYKIQADFQRGKITVTKL